MNRMVDTMLTNLATCGSTAFDAFCKALDEVNPELSNDLRSQARSSSAKSKRLNRLTSSTSFIQHYIKTYSLSSDRIDYLV